MGNRSASRRMVGGLARIATTSVVIAGLALTAGTAGAEPQTKPNGPWVQDAQNLSIASLRSYEQLTAELQSIEKSSGGRMTLESAGVSNEGRDIWLASVGSGDRSILYIAQQHGNEPHGSEAAVHALRTLAQSNHPDVAAIRDELTVMMLVRANPDGAERYWRQNVDPECDDSEDSCRAGRGYDPNRWHDPRVDEAEVPVPETVTMRRVVEEHAPELVVDYHGQVSYRGDNGRMITTSVLWPMYPADVEVTPQRQHATDYGKQVSVQIYDSLQRYGHAEVTLYPSGTTMGTARNAYGYLGIPSVLLEQRSNAGQKSIGMLVRQGYVTMLDIAQGVADGSIAEIDVDRADDLPARGPRITNPNEGKHQERCAPSRGGDVGEVIDVETRLYDYVVEYASEKYLPVGSNRYVRPSTDDACALAAAFVNLTEGRSERAAGLVDDLGYDVVRISDPETGRTHLALSERLDGDWVERGWGLYVHSPDSESDLTVEAPYTRVTTHSERLAAQLFNAADGQNLFVSGAHRRANDADEHGTEPANPTQNDDHVFHKIHVATVTGPSDVVVQTLGAAGDDREVVVTAGQTPPSAFAERVATQLDSAAYDVCLYGDGTCTRLSSTGNLQGQASRAVDANWVALYPSLPLRTYLASRQELAEALAPVMTSSDAQ